MTLLCGDTILFPTGEKNHLFIAITGHHPDPPGQILLVPVCTFHPGRDQSCLLDEHDDHEFIDHLSYAEYYLCRIASEDELIQHIDSGAATIKQRLLRDTLTRVLRGFENSDRVPLWAKQFADSFE